MVGDGTLTRVPDDAEPATFWTRTLVNALLMQAIPGWCLARSTVCPHQLPEAIWRFLDFLCRDRPTARAERPVGRVASAPEVPWSARRRRPMGRRPGRRSRGRVSASVRYSGPTHGEEVRHVPSRRELSDDRLWRSLSRPLPWRSMLHLFDTAQGGSSPSSPRARARCRCTSAAPRSTAHRTSVTAASPSCSTCCAATSSGPGYEVTYVSNITDIDDKIIDRADGEGAHWTEIAAAVRGGLVRGDGRDRRAAPHRTTRTRRRTSTEMVG